ncbi:haloacid dehalogenase type II [Alloalcanivorax marinus]|uniref:haloacid dehalogenase type II n=1 Tax=Alloalcanivorax marinus TaxID=1177169 RepID=UPI0019336051|nr:haloacid dehalogenase type II [Alloalcanivorax marinus]MBL7251386.1 haloacid dehalogenase type II [Alloalcanivorax marinus]
MSIQVVSFDVFGTVVDWFGSIEREVRALHLPVPADDFTLAWRAGYKPAMARVVSGEAPWALIDDIHFSILEEILEQFGVDDLAESQKRHLNLAWHRLDPWPDSSPALHRLKRRFTTCTLSNGNLSLLEDLASHGDLPWSRILSAETFGTFKPDPRMYLGVAETFQVSPEQVLMVATHQDDLEAARAAGLRTAYVKRPLEYGPKGPAKRFSEDHDFLFEDLLEMAARFDV